MPLFKTLPSHAIDHPNVAPPATPSALPFRMFDQKGTQWCWAAVASSVSKFAPSPNSPAYEQCQVAERVLPVRPPHVATRDCCTNGGMANCPGKNSQYNKQADPGVALRQVGHLANQIDQLDFDTIRNEILARRPVCIRFQFTGGDAHVLVICDAYLDGQRTATFSLADPQRPDLYDQSAETLPTWYRLQTGTWTDTYLCQ
jgi:hypothetical protein